MMMALMDDEELAHLTTMLAMMHEDQRMATLANAVVQAANGSPTNAIHNLANLSITISCMLDTQTKLRCIEVLREAANIFESALQTTGEVTATLN